MSQSTASHGEVLSVPERVIIAPVPGRFRPLTDDDLAGDDLAVADGSAVAEQLIVQEQVIGFIDGSGHSTPVRSAFSGLLMGLLAHAGERVREGQPVAWLRLA